MAERLETPEARALAAVAEYQNVTPATDMGDISPELLDAWIEASEGVNMHPEQLRQQAWMHIERAGYAHTHDEQETGEDLDHLTTHHIAAAKRLFKAAFDHPLATPYLQAELDREVASTDILRGIWERDPQAIVGRVRSLKAHQFAIMQRAMFDHAANSGVDSFTKVHAVTLAAIITDKDPTVVPLAPPPRMAASGVDASMRTDLILMVRKARMRLMRAVIADDAPDGFVRLPYKSFSTPTGRFKPELMVSAELVEEAKAFYAPGRPPRNRRPEITQVSERVIAELHEQIEAALAHDETAEPEPAENPFEWYETLPAGRHPYVVAAEKLEQALSQAEIAFAEGEMSADAGYLAGWMYIESGLGRSIERRTAVSSPEGDFDRAEDMLVFAHEKSTEGTMEHYDILLALAATPMYRAIATGQEPPFEFYAAQLAALGENLAGFYASFGDKTVPDAIRADHMIQVITTCLAFAAEPTKSFVLVPSSPRQGDGWHITVWELTNNGFVPQEFGRIVVDDAAEKDPYHAYGRGAVALTSKVLGQRHKDRRAVTMCNLIDSINSTDTDARTIRERTRMIEKAQRETVKVVIAAVN